MSDDLKMDKLKLHQLTEQMHDYDEEIEMKSGENNRLRAQVADLEKAVQDLYGSRKGVGSIHVELNNMKADNEKLIGLLKDTSEYQDLSSTEIMKKAKYLSQQSIGSICKTFNIQPNKAAARRAAQKDGDANEWIPTEAVKKIRELQERNKGLLNETCISQILYDFNIIWRNIMRKENDALKKKYTLQIQDLRRQLVTKKAFDEDESQREISRLKKELHFVQMTLTELKRQRRGAQQAGQFLTGESKSNGLQSMAGGKSASMSGREQEKQALNDENEKLQAQLEQMEGKAYGMDQMSNDY